MCRKHYLNWYKRSSRPDSYMWKITQLIEGGSERGGSEGEIFIGNLRA